MLSVLLSALCPPAPLKSLTFWRYTNQIIIFIIIFPFLESASLVELACECEKDGVDAPVSDIQLLVMPESSGRLFHHL